MSTESHRAPDRGKATSLRRDFVPTLEPVAGARPAVAGGWLLLAGIALVAANMRPAVTSLASVLGDVRDSVAGSSAWASVVTSVPTLCFGLMGMAAPLLARKCGMDRVVGGALAVLTLAMVGRVTGGAWTVLIGTVVVCASVAICNVLVPVVVKESFPGRVGMATGLYTTAMAAGGSVGSAVTPFVDAAAGSWRLSLAVWAGVALAAFGVWVPATLRRPAGGRPSPAPVRGGGASLFRSPLAWAITGYFSMQSLVAYVVMGWMPEVLRSAGMDATSAGGLLGVLLLVGVPVSMVLPPLAARTRSQSGWAVLLATGSLIGTLGLLLAPMGAPILWALLLGLGICGFPLGLVFISLRTRNAADTTELSAMAQCIGYLIASLGPFLFGLLHDLTAGWSASLLAVMGVVVAQAILGIVAGRPRFV
jgi:CP family cyanate transporter-like MFS transporter